MRNKDYIDHNKNQNYTRMDTIIVSLVKNKKVREALVEQGVIKSSDVVKTGPEPTASKGVSSVTQLILNSTYGQLKLKKTGENEYEVLQIWNDERLVYSPIHNNIFLFNTLDFVV